MTSPTAPPPLDYGRAPARRPVRVPTWWVWPAAAFVVVVALRVMTASTNLSREWGRRRACGANLERIGWALREYCRDHGGTYPDTLGTLVRAEPSLSADALICPDDGGATPAAGPTRAAVADAVAAGGHCSYLYLGRGLTADSATAATVVLYEPASPVDRHEAGCNILWGDGRADWHDSADAAKVLPAGSVRPWVPPSPMGGTNGRLQIR